MLTTLSQTNNLERKAREAKNFKNLDTLIDYLFGRERKILE